MSPASPWIQIGPPWTWICSVSCCPCFVFRLSVYPCVVVGGTWNVHTPAGCSEKQMVWLRSRVDSADMLAPRPAILPLVLPRRTRLSGSHWLFLVPRYLRAVRWSSSPISSTSTITSAPRNYSSGSSTCVILVAISWASSARRVFFDLSKYLGSSSC